LSNGRCRLFVCEFAAEDGEVLGLSGIELLVDGLRDGHLQPSRCGGTYKVGVGGLLELLLGAVADVRIWELSVNEMPPRHTRGTEGSVPGEKVPSNTWLISMIAGGSVRESEGSERGV